jgi:hypothetical protein
MRTLAAEPLDGFCKIDDLCRLLDLVASEHPPEFAARTHVLGGGLRTIAEGSVCTVGEDEWEVTDGLRELGVV